MQLAFVPVVKTLELSGASKRESTSGAKKKMCACLMVPGMYCWLLGLGKRKAGRKPA